MKRKHLLLTLLMALAVPLAMWGQKTLPYEYGFENNDLAGEGWTVNTCSSNTKVYQYAKRTGSYGFRFYCTSLCSEQYLISPELSTTTNGTLVEFYYKSSSSSVHTFQVGYSTSTDASSAFTYGDEIMTSGTQWSAFSQTFAAETKYIAIKFTSESTYASLYFDDFSFEEYSEYPAPKNLVMTTYTSSTATLDWTARSGQDHWDIYYSTSNVAPTSSTTLQVGNTDTKPYTLSGLIAGETYYAYVRGNYNNGEHFSNWSNACTFEVGCYTPTIAESQATCNQAYFSWVPVGNETSWQVAFSDQQGFNPDAVTPETVTLQYYVHEGLTTGVTYYARVRAVCGEGDYSDWGEEVSMTTECFAPSNLRESGVTPTTATLAWNLGSNESQWQISYSTMSGFTPESGTIVTVNSRPYTLEGLTLNTQYYAYVRAVCGENIYSDWSDICAFMPKYELTVSDDETNYNGYAPFYTYGISYTAKSQFIIPSSDLSTILYGDISKLTFYATSETASFGDATFDVFISELDGITVFDDYEFFDWDNLTKVYSGSVSVSGNKMEISLNEPYQYMGGDMLIGFAQTSSGSGNYPYWYGAATTGYSTYGGYEASYGSNYNRQKFIPKTTFSYTPGTAPTCMKPKNLASSNVDATSATLTWTKGADETNWVLQYGTSETFDTGTYIEVSVSGDPTKNLTGLSPETTYYARVKADCGGDDYSAWSNVCSFMPSAIQAVVVNDGSGTSYFVPFYGYNTNSQYMKSQFIIPSSELVNVVDQHITKLTFHTGSYYPTVSFPDGVFKVYLLPTELTEFSTSSPVDWSTLTEVYNGSLSVSNNQMEITLSAPYLYTGGNLLVGFEETTLSSSANFVEWLGVTTDYYASYYYAGYNNREMFLPKMTIEYNTAITVCSVPTNLNINATANSATLTWTAGNEETNWNVQYKAASVSDWSEVIAIEDSPACTINGLSPATDYEVRVQANCGSSVSQWLTGDFSTSCAAADLPYSYNFDNDAAGANATFPQCWTRYNDATNPDYQVYPYVYSNTNASHSSPNVLWFRALANDSNYPNTQMAILPEMNADVNTLMLTFWSTSATGGTLKIGVMTDSNDIDTYTEVGTVSIANNGSNHPTKYSFNLSPYQGNGRYIAIRMDKTASNSVIFIDDINLKTTVPEAIPYTHNFDEDEVGQYAGAPDGWTFIGNKYPRVYEGNSHSGSNDMMIFHDGNNPYIRQMAVLPEMDLSTYALQELQIVLWARTWSKMTMSNLHVGVMTNPSDPTTFTVVESFHVGKDYSEYTIPFENYTGQGKYIAISDWAYNDNDTYFLIDDITVEPIPSCKKPGRPYIDSNEIQAHQVWMSWNKGSAEQTLWQLALGATEDFNPNDVTPIDVDVTNEELFDDYGSGCSYYLNGLNAATTYYVYVRGNCGTEAEPDWSDWSSLPSEFTTLGCDVPTGLGCWSYTTTTASLSWNSGNGAENEYELAYSTYEYFDPEYPDSETHVISGITESNYTLEGLAAETVYYARVRANCGDDGHSDWSAPVSFMPSAYHTMTLYEQWKISYRAPLSMIHVHYNPEQDQQGIRGQYILPEIDLSELRFSNIRSISLFSDITTLDFSNNALFNVYLAEVNEPTMNGFVSFDAMTQVYSGTLQISNGEMTIHFDTPFYYSEGNLMVGFKQLTVGDEHNVDVGWKGIDPHVATCYTYDYWFGTKEYGFSPTTRFCYEPCNAPSCPRPVMLKALPMATFAKLSWRFGNGQCDVQYKKVSEADWTLVEGIGLSVNTPYVLRNLAPSTSYVYQVRNVCSEENHSEWSKSCYFTTRSDEPIVIDVDHLYLEDFDGNVFPPTDWVTESDSYVSYWKQRETTQEHYHVAYSGYYNDAQMYSPEIYVAAQGAVLTLNHMHNSSYNGTATYCDIMVSTDHGEHFTPLWGGRDATLVGDWITTRISLDEYVNQNIVLEFYHFTMPDGKHAWDINEIKIKAYNKVFNGSENDNNWDNTDLWALDNGELPTTDDEVLINSSVTIPDNVVAVAGQIYLNNAENIEEIQGSITIEDGGQLQVNDTVTVTMQTNVNGYGRGGSNWYLIAPPVTENLSPGNSHVSGVLVGSYDLYKFDGSYEGEEWRNYKQSPYNFVFQNGQGYLFANSANVSPSFKGTVLPSNQTKEVGLDYAETTFGAWNLVGNPFTCNAYLSGNRPFYRLVETNEDSKIMLATDYVIAPMEGVFVQAADDNDAVTFTTTMPAPSQSMSFSLRKVNTTKDGVSTGSTTLDRARIQFGEGQNFGHLDLMADPNRLYIPMMGKDMSVVHCQPVGELPLNFEAAANGTFGLSFENKTEGLLYCHLIDNLTGADVDLLQQPEYTFNAKAGDYACRFKVVFVSACEDADGDNETFAFNNNGNWIIANPSTGSGSATLQVIDLNGRVLSSEQIEGCAETHINAAAGIYVIRLINGENVRTQKVIVK